MRTRQLVIGLGILFAVASSVPATIAHAQPTSSNGGAVTYPPACNASAVSQQNGELAHTLYLAGKAYYDEANYDAAIQQFRESYRKDCSKPDLLIIISRAYELKGDRAAAITALETYLERVPSSPEAQQHKARIENLRKELLKQPPPAATVTATAPPPPPPEVREHTALPWLVVGLGGAAVVTGAILLVVAPKLPDTCQDTNSKCHKDETIKDPAAQNTQLSKDQDQAGKHVGFTTGGLICIIGGVGIAGAGVLWHFLEPTGPAERTGSVKKPKVTPEVSPGYAGVSLGGSF